MPTRSAVRITVRWFKKFSSGRIDKDIEIDSDLCAYDKPVWEIVDEAIVPWAYDEYEMYRVEESPNVEFELELKDADAITVAQDFVDDISEMLTLYRG